MDIFSLYKCLCDEQRLRILNLLNQGPLCVCHIMDILQEDQVRVSKQLRYMKNLGMVVSDRVAQWMVYRLADPGNALLVENLKCLQDVFGEHVTFRRDLIRRAEIVHRLSESGLACSGMVSGVELPPKLTLSTGERPFLD